MDAHNRNDYNVNNDESVVFPDTENDYHGHPHYAKVLVSLLALLSLSLLVGFLFSPLWAIVIIFATAIWKTALVMRNFMHLKYEPLLLFIVISAVLLIIVAFFFGVYPDITAIHPSVTLPR
ncbi:MAG: cytochrome C oxidase subunit IV family protein [Bacteroidia bacterium]